MEGTDMLWQWLIFASVLLCSVIGVLFWVKWLNKVPYFSEQSKKYKICFIVKEILYYWLCDLFYMAFIINQLVPKYVFGCIIILMIFYNFAQLIIKPSFISKFCILRDFVIVIGITICLIFLIESENLRNVIIPIIAGVYGGLLTLVGVAWTIRDNNRKAELNHRLKYKPFFVKDNSKHTYNSSETIQAPFVCVEKNEKLGEDNVYYWGKPFFTNIGEKPFILNYLRINDSKMYFYERQVIMPQQTFCPFPNNRIYSLINQNSELQQIKFGVLDVNYNLYEYQVEFYIATNSSHRNGMDIKDFSDNDLVIEKNGMVIFKHLKFNYVDCSPIDCVRAEHRKVLDGNMKLRKKDIAEHFNIDFDKDKKGD